MLTSEKLNTLLTYYLFHRQVGHTHAMVYGAINTENPIILTATHTDRDYIRPLFPLKKTPTFVEWDSLEYLRGRSSPLLIDNHATIRILEDTLSLISRLEKENKELRDKLNTPVYIFEKKKPPNYSPKKLGKPR